MAALLTSSGRPGFYLRVLEEGEACAGDPIVKVAEGPERMTIEQIDALCTIRHHPRAEPSARSAFPRCLLAGARRSRRCCEVAGAGPARRATPGSPPPPSPRRRRGSRPLRVSRYPSREPRRALVVARGRGRAARSRRRARPVHRPPGARSRARRRCTELLALGSALRRGYRVSVRRPRAGRDVSEEPRAWATSSTRARRAEASSSARAKLRSCCSAGPARRPCGHACSLVGRAPVAVGLHGAGTAIAIRSRSRCDASSRRLPAEPSATARRR